MLNQTMILKVLQPKFSQFEKEQNIELANTLITTVKKCKIWVLSKNSEWFQSY